MLAKIVKDQRYLFAQDKKLNATGDVSISFSAANGMAQLQLVVRDKDGKDLRSVGTPQSEEDVISTANGSVTYRFTPPPGCSPDGYISWSIYITSTEAGGSVVFNAQLSQDGGPSLPVASMQCLLNPGENAAHAGYDGLYFA
ncbi:MAG: hypothetical protein WA071_26735 [Undibacterium umbellatum]|uniref:hypothetical protein n=1 Tax=Undibacterium umbellatum TaxID=2762300 RepID=UPI003BB56B78